MSKLATLLATAALSAGLALGVSPSEAAAPVVPGTAHYVAHKVTNKKQAAKDADQWDAWRAYNEAFTDGCFEDFATSPRRLVRDSDDVSGAPSKIHRGLWWDFEIGEGC